MYEFDFWVLEHTITNSSIGISRPGTTTCICSKVRTVLLTTRRRCNLTERTDDSLFPPQCGEWGGIKLYLIPSLASDCGRLRWWSCEDKNCCISFNARLAPTKFVPLSLKIYGHFPRRDMKRPRHARNVSVLRSVASSKCMADVTRQTKRHM